MRRPGKMAGRCGSIGRDFPDLEDPAGEPDSAEISAAPAKSASLATAVRWPKTCEACSLPFVSAQWIARRLEPDEQALKFSQIVFKALAVSHNAAACKGWKLIHHTKKSGDFR